MGSANKQGVPLQSLTMTTNLRFYWLIFIGLLSSPGLAWQEQSAGESPQTTEDAAAGLFATHCYSCHNDVDREGGLSMQTHAALIKGGENGPALIPGDADESRMVQMVEGFLEPTMPEDDFLFDEDIKIIRDWIEAGAPAWRGNLARLKVVNLPDIEPTVATQAEIASIAFHPEGRLLAAGTYQEVRFIDVDSGTVQARLTGPVETVRSLAYSGDGSLLAAAGGLPSRYGEVKIWQVSTGKLLHTLEGHNDAVYSVAFSPDDTLLATCGYDHSIKIWDVTKGTEIRTIGGHVDAVYSLAFDPAGKLLASASADRTVKIWDVVTGQQLFPPLNESTGELYTLAIHPQGDLIAAAGEDKMIRLWRITERGGELLRSAFAHDGPVQRLVFTPDGKMLISTGSDQLVKFWDVTTLQESTFMEKQPDWVLALAVSPDGQVLATGRYDGAVDFHAIGSK